MDRRKTEGLLSKRMVLPLSRKFDCQLAKSETPQRAIAGIYQMQAANSIFHLKPGRILTKARNHPRSADDRKLRGKGQAARPARKPGNHLETIALNASVFAVTAVFHP